MINEKRLKKDFSEISKFGALKNGGITRLAFSKEDLEAREFLLKILKDFGFKIKIDEIGNIFARIDGKNPNLPAVSVGSHIDSVPNGGIYDGTLGVMCGLEAIRSIKENGVNFKRSLELIVFSCEESSRFKMATLGSKVISGKLNKQNLKDLKDDDKISVFDAAKKCGFDVENLQNAIKPNDFYHSYIELHIEQGPVLQNQKATLGAVSAIAAPIRYEVKIFGRADHSGATPMNMRKDTLCVASEIVLAVERIAKFELEKTSVATTGYIKTIPGVLNVIPGECILGIDIRDITKNSLNRANDLILKEIEKICEHRDVKFEIKNLAKDMPVILDLSINSMIFDTATNKNINCIMLPSGAGHDAMHMNSIAKKVGMIFIPCKDGISHNILESINFDDAIKGCEVLCEMLIKLANEE